MFFVSHASRAHDDEAKARFDAAWSQYGKIAPEWFIAVLPLMGHEQDLRDLIKAWDAGTRPSNAGMHFMALNALGEYDAAIDWLIRAADGEDLGAVVERNGVPDTIRLDKFYPQIHAHPRWPEFLAKLEAKEVTH